MGRAMEISMEHFVYRKICQSLFQEKHVQSAFLNSSLKSQDAELCIHVVSNGHHVYAPQHDNQRNRLHLNRDRNFC